MAAKVAGYSVVSMVEIRFEALITTLPYCDHCTVKRTGCRLTLMSTLPLSLTRIPDDINWISTNSSPLKTQRNMLAVGLTLVLASPASSTVSLVSYDSQRALLATSCTSW